jgi:hypothetical protein
MTTHIRWAEPEVAVTVERMGEFEYVTEPRRGTSVRRMRPRGKILSWALLSVVWLLVVGIGTPAVGGFVTGTLKASQVVPIQRWRSSV